MLSDFKHTLRSLLKSPGFIAVVLFTLALGVGATISIFSVVNAVLLRPLPYAQPERLALLHTQFPTFARGEEQRFPFSRVEYLDLRRETMSWRSLEAWTHKGANIATATEPMRVTTAFVTGGFFSSLGVTAAFGRIITPLDDTPAAPLVAVISNSLWQRVSTVGIYGIVSYTVSRRTKEVGVRMALGAGHGDVLGLVLRNALALVFCGVSIGLAGAFATTRLLSGFLFDITATDPLTFVAVSVFFGVVAIIASYFPARRATQVDPLVALRAE